MFLDHDAEATYEAVVSLDEQRVTSWKHVPGTQHRVMFDQFAECEALVRANPDFQAAIKKRGITDPSLVMIEPWSAGNYGFDDEQGRRLVLARNFVRTSTTDNGYARPIEGGGNCAPEFVGAFRKDLKPLEITQPEGAIFEVDGHGVAWQNWRLRIGFNPGKDL